jgi:peptidoglycan/LPS O-acetylase OafA/YrhL
MSYIFINALGISELLSRILAAAGSVDYLIFACLAYFVIERYGRRKVRTSQPMQLAIRTTFLGLQLTFRRS